MCPGPSKLESWQSQNRLKVKNNLRYFSEKRTNMLRWGTLKGYRVNPSTAASLTAFMQASRKYVALDRRSIAVQDAESRVPSLLGKTAHPTINRLNPLVRARSARPNIDLQYPCRGRRPRPASMARPSRSFFQFCRPNHVFSRLSSIPENSNATPRHISLDDSS